MNSHRILAFYGISPSLKLMSISISTHPCPQLPILTLLAKALRIWIKEGVPCSHIGQLGPVHPTCRAHGYLQPSFHSPCLKASKNIGRRIRILGHRISKPNLWEQDSGLDSQHLHKKLSLAAWASNPSTGEEESGRSLLAAGPSVSWGEVLSQDIHEAGSSKRPDVNLRHPSKYIKVQTHTQVCTSPHRDTQTHTHQFPFKTGTGATLN